MFAKEKIDKKDLCQIEDKLMKDISAKEAKLGSYISKLNEQIKKTLPNNFNDENLICASVPGRKGGTCKGDSGGILMKNEFMGPPINDFR